MATAHASPGQRLLQGLSLLLGLALAALFVITPLGLKAQAMLGVLLFVVALVVNRWRSRGATLLLVALSIAVSSRYLHWRLTATMGLLGGVTFSNVMAVVLLCAELYTFVVLLLGFLQSTWPLHRPPIPLPKNPAHWPTVDVYVPSYNEPLDVVRATVLAAMQIDWPEDKLRVFILDDGRRAEFRAYAERVGCGYIIRPDNNHAKAGNINHAMGKTRGEYIAIFDCDHIPTRSFLQTTMGWLVRDPRLALVQTPHHFYSPDPFEKNLRHFRRMPNEGELFYGLLQPGNDLFDAVFFCGSCAVIRRTALEEVGGIAVETVTEDAHTALKLHRRGWKTAFLGVPQASGLATETLGAHVGQRVRWARGMVQIFRIDNPLLGRGLTLWQRLCYTSAMVHFLFAGPRLVFLVAPLSFLLFGAHIFNASPLVVIAYALPHLAHTNLTNSRVQGKYRRSFWAEVYETAISFYILLPTTLALIVPSWGKFNVTAKGGITDRDFFDGSIARPYLALLALNAVGVGIGVWALAMGLRAPDAVVINLFWAIYNIGILGATLHVAWETRQVRRANRVEISLPVDLHVESSGRVHRADTVDVSFGGAALRTAEELVLEGDEPVTLGLRLNHEEFPVAARVVDVKGHTVRLAFDDLTVEEEGWLVRAVFSRANAWIDWRSEEPDRPLRELFVLWGLAVRAIPRTLGHLLGIGRKRVGSA